MRGLAFSSGLPVESLRPARSEHPPTDRESDPDVIRSRTSVSPLRFQPRAIALAVVLCLGGPLAAGAAIAQTASATPPFDIPAGPLGAALDRFARVAGVNLTYEAKAVAGRDTRGLSGAFDADTGLRILLQGTGLSAVRAAGGFTLELAPAGAATLEPVRVRAAVETDPAIGPLKGYVARESATATKTGTPLREIPQSISVIGRPEMEARGAANSGDPLLYTPGVLPVLYGADDRMNSGDSGVTSRGFDSAAGNYLDGLRQPKSSTSWSYPRTEVYGLERVEVLRGPASTAFGQGDVGGVISRVSKRPDAQAPREVELQLGNFDRRQFAIDVGGAVGSDDAVQWRLVGVSLEHEPQGYDLTKRNVVTYDPVTFDARQVGEVRSRGIELEAKVSLARGLDLAAQYTVNDIENTADSNAALVGKRPTLIPKHLAAAWLDYTVQGGDLAGLGGGLGARYTGSRYGNAVNTVENPSVTMVDAAAHYTTGPWRLSLNAQNLFDRDNGVYGYGVYYQGLRRTVTATARYRF